MWDWIPKEERDLMTGVFAIQDARERQADPVTAEWRKQAKPISFTPSPLPEVIKPREAPQDKPATLPDAGSRHGYAEND